MPGGGHRRHDPRHRLVPTPSSPSTSRRRRCCSTGRPRGPGAPPRRRRTAPGTPPPADAARPRHSARGLAENGVAVVSGGTRDRRGGPPWRPLGGRRSPVGVVASGLERRVPQGARHPLARRRRARTPRQRGTARHTAGVVPFPLRNRSSRAERGPCSWWRVGVGRFAHHRGRRRVPARCRAGGAGLRGESCGRGDERARTLTAAPSRSTSTTCCAPWGSTRGGRRPRCSTPGRGRPDSTPSCSTCSVRTPSTSTPWSARADTTWGGSPWRSVGWRRRDWVQQTCGWFRTRGFPGHVGLTKYPAVRGLADRTIYAQSLTAASTTPWPPTDATWNCSSRGPISPAWTRPPTSTGSSCAATWPTSRPAVPPPLDGAQGRGTAPVLPLARTTGLVQHDPTTGLTAAAGEGRLAPIVPGADLAALLEPPVDDDEPLWRPSPATTPCSSCSTAAVCVSANSAVWTWTPSTWVVVSSRSGARERRNVVSPCPPRPPRRSDSGWCRVVRSSPLPPRAVPQLPRGRLGTRDVRRVIDRRSPSPTHPHALRHTFATQSARRRSRPARRARVVGPQRRLDDTAIHHTSARSACAPSTQRHTRAHEHQRPHPSTHAAWEKWYESKDARSREQLIVTTRRS